MLEVNLLCKSELEVYNMALTDMSYEEMASKRGVKLSTIKTQLDHIYKKLLVNGRIELMADRIKDLEDEICSSKY